MITTLHLGMDWADAPPETSETLRISDSRILAAAYKVLQDRPGVIQVDLVRTGVPPVWVVALDDIPTGSSFSERYAVTAMVGWLTDPSTVSVVFAADGGWKTVLAHLNFWVMP